jgi:hypothetical protein
VTAVIVAASPFPATVATDVFDELQLASVGELGPGGPVHSP